MLLALLVFAVLLVLAPALFPSLAKSGKSFWDRSTPEPVEVDTNWDQIEGQWKHFTGSARERWGEFTDNDWDTIAGKKDQLVGRIQERYGLAKAEAEQQADEWSRGLK
jgi:uncharacterized protein YjbJ (UPF0337 family)